MSDEPPPAADVTAPDRLRSKGRRTAALAAVGGREVLRDPVLVGVLTFVPAYFVGVWGWITPDDELPATVPAGDGAETVVLEFGELLTALVGPVTGAVVVGIAGLFLVQRSRDVDERLRVLGFSAPELLAARFAVLVAIAVLVAAVTVLVGWPQLQPDHLGWYLVALLFAAGTYGAFGALAGQLLGRMAGVYLLLFAPMLDLMLLQSPLADAPDWTEWLPGHHAAHLAQSAAFAPEVAVGHASWALWYLAALAVLAAAVSVWQ